MLLICESYNLRICCVINKLYSWDDHVIRTHQSSSKNYDPQQQQVIITLP